MAVSVARSEVDLEIATFRRDNGLCPYCGTKCYEVEKDRGGGIRSLTPLTVEDSVHNGRCLYCYPLSAGGGSPNDNRERDNARGGDVPQVIASGTNEENLEADEEPDDSQGPNDEDPPPVTPVRDVRVPCRRESASTANSSVSTTTERSRWEVPKRRNRLSTARTGGGSTPFAATRAARPETPISRGTNPNTCTVRQSEREAEREGQQRQKQQRQWIQKQRLERQRQRRQREQQSKQLAQDDGSSEESEEESQVQPSPQKRARMTPSDDEDEEEKTVYPIPAKIQDLKRCWYNGHLTKGTTKKGEGKFERTIKTGKFKGKITSYEGEIVNGRMEGRGKSIPPNGRIYEGEFKNGAANGHGTCIFPSDGGQEGPVWKYEGEWVDDTMNGQGRMFQVDEDGNEISDGEVYEGEFLKDKRTGRGKFKYVQGAFSEGEFKDGKEHGKAKYWHADGAVYEGEFRAGERWGKGKITYAGEMEGQIYEGSWSRNLCNGMGTLWFPDGSQYKGNFKDDLRNGTGTMWYPNGSECKGIWKNDERNGKATVWYPDGSKYQGTFKDDKIYNGVTASPDGSKKMWKNGKNVTRK